MFEVIFLIIIGTVLVILNYKAIMKEKKSFSSSLNQEQSNLKDYDIEIGKLRIDFSEDISQIQREIVELRESIEKSETVEKREIIEKKEHLELNSNSVRIDEIKKMLEKNTSIDEIAKKLNIGKGEVLLIKELYIK